MTVSEKSIGGYGLLNENWLFGITNTEIEGFKVRIYDVEKCVCDAVKYRNKIGIDVCTEIIKEYLKRRDRNVSKLMKYASQLRVAKTLGTYLQMEL